MHKKPDYPEIQFEKAYDDQKVIVSVKLLRDEADLARIIGIQRELGKPDKTRGMNKIFLNTKKTSMEFHQDGVMGEMAFSKLTGLNMDMNIRQSGDRADFEISGRRIEIKTSNFAGPDIELKVVTEEYKRKPMDYYVLARLMKNSAYLYEGEVFVEFIGKISRKDFNLRKQLKQYPGQKNNNYVLDALQLDDIPKAWWRPNVVPEWKKILNINKKIIEFGQGGLNFDA